MYYTLLTIHSLMRWLAPAMLLYTLFRAYKGYAAQHTFSTSDNAWHHWTATIAHIQLVIGIVLYLQSPVVTYARTHFSEVDFDGLFFTAIHPLLMIVAIVVITIGSALAKR